MTETPPAGRRRRQAPSRSGEGRAQPRLRGGRRPWPILAGGSALGLLAGRRRLGRVVPLMTAGVALGCAVPVALASRRPPISPHGAAAALGPDGHGLDAQSGATARPTFTVLVGARDEAAVLPQLVRDVAGQDYRGRRRRAALRAGRCRRPIGGRDRRRRRPRRRDCGIDRITRVIRREGESCPDGKGAALTAAQPRECRGDVVLVLDADARIEPWFLTRAAGYFAAGRPRGDCPPADPRLRGQAGWPAPRRTSRPSTAS